MLLFKRVLEVYMTDQVLLIEMCFESMASRTLCDKVCVAKYGANRTYSKSMADPTLRIERVL